MLMGDKDHIKIRRQQPPYLEPSANLFQAQATIDQNPCRIKALRGRLDHQGVAATAAG
jgi:hypothetical protein